MLQPEDFVTFAKFSLLSPPHLSPLQDDTLLKKSSHQDVHYAENEKTRVHLSKRPRKAEQGAQRVIGLEYAAKRKKPKSEECEEKKGYVSIGEGATTKQKEREVNQKTDDKEIVWVAKRIWADGKLKTVAIRKSVDDANETSKQAVIPALDEAGYFDKCRVANEQTEEAVFAAWEANLRLDLEDRSPM